MNGQKLYYTIYLASNDEVVASGLATQCAQQMNMTLGTFYSTVSRVNRKKNQKYEVLREKEYEKLCKD